MRINSCANCGLIIQPHQRRVCNQPANKAARSHLVPPLHGFVFGGRTGQGPASVPQPQAGTVTAGAPARRPCAHTSDAGPSAKRPPAKGPPAESPFAESPSAESRCRQPADGCKPNEQGG